MPVFISHSFKDEAIYSTLCLALDSAGIKRWDPASMSAGDPLAGQLYEAISKCEVCVSIATRRSIESPWCLAELGAFWGAGKKVVLFLVDPDLTDAMLPPQFKGNLLANTAQELINAIKEAMRQKDFQGRNSLECFESSAVFGPGDSQWLSLLHSPAQKYCSMGVALNSLVKMKDFDATVKRKTENDGVEFKFMTLHPVNPSIIELESTKRTGESAPLVREKIAATSSIFIQLASEHSKVQYRQLKVKTPNFALTLTDHSAVLVQYLHSLNWGSGPVLRCFPTSALYPILEREFDHLWQLAEEPLTQ